MGTGVKALRHIPWFLPVGGGSLHLAITLPYNHFGHGSTWGILVMQAGSFATSISLMLIIGAVHGIREDRRKR